MTAIRLEKVCKNFRQKRTTISALKDVSLTVEQGEVFGFVSEGIIRYENDLANYNKIDLAAGQVWYNGSV